MIFSKVSRQGGWRLCERIAIAALQRLTLFVLLLILMAALPRLLPGDPLALILGEEAQALNLDHQSALRVEMGLSSDGFFNDVVKDVTHILKGQLGHSASHGADVSTLVFRALPWTVFLTFLACPLFLLIGVSCGIEAGRLAGRRLDRILCWVMSAQAATPPFAVAMLLLICLAIAWPILPAGGAESLIVRHYGLARFLDIAFHALLPALALALHEVSRYFFIIRGEVISISRRPFVQTALANGISLWRERLDLYLANLSAVILSRLSYSIPTLLGAALFVEVVFAYPGIGSLSYQAVLDRDYTLLQGATAVLAAIILITNWILDTLVMLVSERG